MKPRTRVDARIRFADKVDQSGPWSPVVGSQCWQWTASTREGYGQFWLDGQPRPAHRFSYEQHIGPVPDGLDLDHLCRNRACVNPEHLEPVTRSENVKRTFGEAVGRLYIHCAHGHEVSGQNEVIWNDGRRRCRTCVNARKARSRRKQTQVTT